MTTLEVLKSIADNVYVNVAGYGTWEIKATITVPRIDDEDDEVITLKEITHNEENKTGIFDGSIFNPLCGFRTHQELNEAAAESGMTVEEFQKTVWADSANEDNYEPDDVRDARLAEWLYESLEYLDVFDYLDITD